MARSDELLPVVAAVGVLSMLIRTLWLTISRYPRLNDTLWSRDALAVACGSLAVCGIYVSTVSLIPRAEVSWLVVVVTLEFGLSLLSFYYVSTFIPRKTEERARGVEQAWGLLLALLVAIYGLAFVGRISGFPPSPQDLDWATSAIIVYSIALFLFSIYFRRVLPIAKTVLGTLPIVLPVTVAFVARLFVSG